MAIATGTALALGGGALLGGLAASSGKKGAQPQQQTVTQTNLPEYARPYFENMMQRSSGLLGQPYIPFGFTQNQQGQVVRATDPTTGQPVNADRIADFTPQQQALQQDILSQRTPGEFGTASGLATAAGLGSLRAGQYAPGQFGAQQIGMPNLQQFSMSAPGMVQGGQFGTPQMQTAQTGFRPDLQQFQMGPVRDVSSQAIQAPQMQGAQTGFRPDLQQFQMGQVGRVGGVDVNAPMMQAAQTGFGQQPLEQFRMDAPQAFGLEQAQQYMSPFIQQALEPQRQEAIRSAQQDQIAQNLGAARQGTYGGSRQLIAGLERERNLQRNLSDIQARGMETAFGQAQQQFERDRAAGMTAGQQNLEAALRQQQLGTQTGLQAALANLSNEQQAAVNNQATQFQAQGMSAENAMRAALANQGVDLTRAQADQQAALGVQQLGTQTGLQTALANLSNEQQAAVNNQAAQLQAQGLNQEQALRAALANQGVDLTRAQADQQAALGVQQLGTQAGLQTALANLDAASQANVQNLAAQLQTQGLSADQALRAALANQQAELTTGQQNLGAALQTQQLGAQTGLEALRANQQADLERQRMMEQSRQFGSQQGLAGLAQAGQMGQTLSNIGTGRSQADQARFGLQTQTAAQQQALNQQFLDERYQEFLRQRDYPLEMLQQYSSLLRGVPVVPGSTQTTYAQQPGIAQQLLGAGLGGLSLYNMLGAGRG
jgi:hypothetical protein